MARVKVGIVKTRSGHYVVWVRTLCARQLRWVSSGMSLHGAQGLSAAIKEGDVGQIRGFDVAVKSLLPLLYISTQGA